MSIIAVYRDVPKPPVDFTEFDFAALPIDPRITFTRASAATYFDSNGVMQTAAINEPRIDHDPVTGAVRGLLVEEQRTNTILFSASVGNFVTSAPAFLASDEVLVVEENAVIAPNGTSKAHRFRINKQGNLNTRTVSTGWAYYDQQHYPTAFVRSNLRYCRVIVSSSITSSAIYDLQTGDIVNIGSSYSATNYVPTVRKCGNGWARVALAAHAGGGGYYCTIEFSATTNFRNGSNSPNDYFDIWGLQREVGRFPTSYIPTEGTAMTRAVDSPRVAPGSAIRINKSAGTLFIEGANNGVYSSLGSFIGVGANGFNAVGTTERWWNSNSNITSLPAAILGQKRKSVFAYTDTSRAIAVNGSAVVQDNSAPWPTGEPTGIQIGGANGSSAQVTSGPIRRLRYYPRRLSNAELQELTA